MIQHVFVMQTFLECLMSNMIMIPVFSVVNLCNDGETILLLETEEQSTRSERRAEYVVCGFANRFNNNR